MKIEFFRSSVLGAAIVVLGLMGVPSPIHSPAQTSTGTSPPPANNTTAAAELPSFIYPTSPLAQVVRLSQAGVDQSVILTFIANSTSTFNLDSDKIIYLKDIGLPNELVTAMMQRDQQLQSQMAAAPQPATPPAPAPETPAEPPAAPPTEVTINHFYDTLAPYGSWITVEGYGRCWRPSVVVYNPGWQPYCDHGRWIYSDCGWYWYSDYSWGWAPFHYGRWLQHPHWGWCWMPDTVWGPSWVTWRHSSDYCGWAPLPPFAVFRPGGGFFYRGAAVSVGFNWGLSLGCFTFVPTRYFCDPYPRRHCLPPPRVTQIFNQTTVINNFQVRDHRHVNPGIDPGHITTATHVPIHPVTIQNGGPPPGGAAPGHGPRGDHFSRDGGTLYVSHPPRTGFPAQNHPPQQNHNQTVPPGHQGQTPPAPGTTRNPRQGGAIQVTPQPPSSPATHNNNPSTPPNQNNRGYSPRQRELLPSQGTSRSGTLDPGASALTPPSHSSQSGVIESGRRNAPAAAPATTPPQHNSPASPPPASSSPRSSEHNSSQNRSDNNSGGGSGSGSVGGRDSGPRH